MDQRLVLSKSKINASDGYSDQQLRNALVEIFMHFGYDLNHRTKAQQQDIADRLSFLAKRETPWGYLYVHNFMYNNLKAGRDFKDAVIRLAMLIDGTPIRLVQSTPVMVQALGNVVAGSFVFGDSKQCANQGCGAWFVTDIKRKRYCCAECRKAARKAI